MQEIQSVSAVPFSHHCQFPVSKGFSSHQKMFYPACTKRGFSTSEEAKVWERIFLIKARNEITNKIIFGELYEIYKKTKKGKIKDCSYNDMEYLAKSIISPYWKSVELSKITLKRIEMWQNDLLTKTYTIKKNNVEKLYSNRHLESIQTQFKAILRYGLMMGYITDIRICEFKLAKRSNEIKKKCYFGNPMNMQNL